MIFATPDKGDSIVAVARNPEREVEEALDAAEDAVDAEGGDASSAVDDAGAGVADVDSDAVPSEVEDDTAGGPE